MTDCNDKKKDGWRLAHYQRVSEDLRRYRDYRWKIPIWTATFLLGLGAAGLKMPLVQKVRIPALVLAVLTGALAISNLHRCYDAYVNYRNCLNKYEGQHDMKRVPASSSCVYWRCACWKKALDYVGGVLSCFARHCLPRFLWPAWEDVDNAHRVFRLGWFGLITATVLFAAWAMCVGPRRVESAPATVVNVDVLPVLKAQVNTLGPVPSGQSGSGAYDARAVLLVPRPQSEKPVADEGDAMESAGGR